MMIIASRFVFLSASALAFAGLAQAQAPVLRDQTTPGVVDISGAGKAVDPQREVVERADEQARAFEHEQITDPTVFVKSAALGDLTGIELAKLARSKSQDADIRGFAGRMLEDHDAARLQLAAIARRKRLDVPTSLVYEDEQMLKQADGKTGAEFDAWYTRQTITEYQKAIDLFESAAKMQDAELSAFAKKTLPVLDERQKMAIALIRDAQP